MTSFRVMRLVVPVALICAFACSSADPTQGRGDSVRYGVAVRKGESICFSMRGAALPAKTVVTLVNPADPQSMAEAEVTRSGVASGCPGIQDDLPAYVNYELKVIKGEARRRIPLFVVTAPATKFREERQRVVARFENDGSSKPAGETFFRSCTSQEGVHLTVWEGQPLKGRRIWHEYYYLGYDVEPTCSDKDI